MRLHNEEDEYGPEPKDAEELIILEEVESDVCGV